MNSKTRVRNWGAKTNVAIILASIVAVLFAAALVTAFAVQPPTLGWVGFGIVSMIVFGLGALATVVVPRMRVSAPRPAAAVDEERRLLVVADAYCSAAALCDRIQARLDGAVSVHLVVPVRVSHLHFLANDEAEERRDAEATMVIAVELLRGRGILTTGAVGSDKPLESMTDTLGAFPATHVLLALPPEEESYWLERDLLEKAQALTELPVTQVVVPSTPPARPEAAGRTVQRQEPPDDPGRPSGRGARTEEENVMTTAATPFEKPRMEIGRATPPLHRALVMLGNQVELDPRLRELVNLRASILNGCAYCIDKHTKIARRAGESEQRLYALAAWHEAAFFDAKERAALALTDAVTLIAEQHVPRDVWDEASAHFEPDELAQLVWAITVINAWNRIAITTRMLPAA